MQNRNANSLCSRLSAPLMVTGLIFFGLSLASIAGFIITFFVFSAMGWADYYWDYLILMGPYLAPNILVVCFYVMFLLGGLGLPFLAGGIITNILAKKKQQ